MPDESCGPVDDFLDRCLRGERVDAVAFIAQHPELPPGERDLVLRIACVLLDGAVSNGSFSRTLRKPRSSGSVAMSKPSSRHILSMRSLAASTSPWSSRKPSLSA